jgi:hypothetical protein
MYIGLGQRDEFLDHAVILIELYLIDVWRSEAEKRT